MKIKNNYDCEICKNKEVCKYYDTCKRYSNKELGLKTKHVLNEENLQLTITCKHYTTESTILNYPEGCRSNDPNSSGGFPGVSFPYTLNNISSKY